MVRYGGAVGLSYLGDDGISGGTSLGLALLREARIVHDDLGSPFGQFECVRTADTASGTRYDNYPIGK